MVLYQTVQHAVVVKYHTGQHNSITTLFWDVIVFENTDPSNTIICVCSQFFTYANTAFQQDVSMVR